MRITLFLTVLASCFVASQPAAAQFTGRASVGSSGVEGDDNSETPMVASTILSADGRFIAFHSEASNLVPLDNGIWVDVFVHDRRTGQTTRVSVSSSGSAGSGSSLGPVISADGRFVTFESQASDLVQNDINGMTDIFLHDRLLGTTTRVSVDTNEKEANGGSRNNGMSADGRYLVFHGGATNLAPSDTNGVDDVFVRDVVAGTTTRVSIDSAGLEGDGDSWGGSISADGYYTVYYSRATNLVPADRNGMFDVFLRDQNTRTTTRLSVNAAGAEGNGDSMQPTISADGLYVAFHSMASNLVPGDQNGTWDVFVWDRLQGTLERVSEDPSGGDGDDWSYWPSLSADGEWITFYSNATNLVPGDSNGNMDVFLRHRRSRATTLVSVDSSGNQASFRSYWPFLSGDGRFVAFTSDDQSLVPGDTNLSDDVFVHGPGLTLEAAPELAPPGAQLTLTTWGGLPSGLVLLYSIRLNGSPFVTRIRKGLFDSGGEWSLGGTVPPGLSGLVIELMGMGQTINGKLGATGLETVTFQ